MAPAPAQPAPARPDWTRGPSGVIAALALACLASLACLRSLDHAPAGGFTALAPHASKLDLNTATAAELELLPRIGPALAGRIATDRAARGPFRSVDDLDRVPGIGPRTVERLRPFVLAGAAPPAGR